MRIILKISANKLERIKPVKHTSPIMLAAALLCTAFLFSPGRSVASTSIRIRFAGHHFTPQTLNVPAGQPLAVKVTNASNETIEFESFRLNREVAMTPGETITVRLPALNPGNYDFYDDFHQDVPQGAILAK